MGKVKCKKNVSMEFKLFNNICGISTLRCTIKNNLFAAKNYGQSYDIAVEFSFKKKVLCIKLRIIYILE